jgi:hypothetical protein
MAVCSDPYTFVQTGSATATEPYGIFDKLYTQATVLCKRHARM